MWGHLTIYHCWPGRGPAAACSHQETSGGGGVITRSDLRDGLLGQAEADPLLDSAPPGLLGDQDRPLVVVRHPDWSEQGAAGAVPGISSSVRCTHNIWRMCQLASASKSSIRILSEGS